MLLRLVISTTLSLTSLTNYAYVGTVTEQTGPTEIVRNRNSTPSKVGSGIEMNDAVVTARAKAKLTFEDNTTVNITEQSKLIIDDFVYDPKTGSGKLAMKVMLGTAKYASGQIAKTNPQSVNVKTPTATIAVRGTDFSMSVDELGRSLVVLLPSCDAKTCVTGAIEVSTDAGKVFMDVAYQTTYVASSDQTPTKPIVITIDQNNINNFLIISPPQEVEKEKFRTDTKTALDVNFLDKDLLKYTQLDEDTLKYNALDIKILDVDLLSNLLDESNKALSASQESMLAQNSMLPGYSEMSGLKYGIADNDKLVLYRINTHTAQITIGKDSDKTININQDGSVVYQQVNRSGTSINITQK